MNYSYASVILILDCRRVYTVKSFDVLPVSAGASVRFIIIIKLSARARSSSLTLQCFSSEQRGRGLLSYVTEKLESRLFDLIRCQKNRQADDIKVPREI